MLRDKYIDEIRNIDVSKHNEKIYKATRFYYSNDNTNTLYNNVTKIEFKQLFINIIIDLINIGLLDIKWKESVEKAKWFLKNKEDIKSLNNDEYLKCKTYCNSLYSKIDSPYIIAYLNLYYRDIIDKYQDKIIYIDTNLVILDIKKEEFSKDIIEEFNDFDYEYSSLEYFYPIRIKKYLIRDNSKTIIKGRISDDDINKIENLIKMDRRSKILNSLNI